MLKQIGNRIGSSRTSYLNNPSSVAYWLQDSQRTATALSSKVYIVKNSSCTISQQLQSLTFPLSLSNLLIQPFPNLFSINPSFPQQYLFIADKKNHCIKKILLNDQFIEVIAGICGQSGFRDGPFSYNLLNKPSNLGIDSKGIVYFFDQGSQYIRKVNKNGQVQTLLNGACMEYKKQNKSNRFINNYELKKMICYENWIEKETTSNVDHYVNQDTLNICTQHSSKCPAEMRE